VVEVSQEQFAELVRLRHAVTLTGFGIGIESGSSPA